MLEKLQQKQFLPIPRAEAWEFFSQPKNLDAITPSDLGFETISCPDGEVYEGALIIHRIQLAPLMSMKWVTEIKSVTPGVAFVDEQRYGPYAFWHHRHSFEDAEGGTLMHDVVHWKAPLEPFSWPVKELFVRPKVNEIFRFRKEILEKHFAR